MRSLLIQARTKKLFKQKKRDSWENYVSSVNVNTPSKKVWNMIRKVTGKNVASPMHHIKDENGTLITDRVQIANTLGAAIEKSSSSKNYSKEFQSILRHKRKSKISTLKQTKIFVTIRICYDERFKTILKKVQQFISRPRSDPIWNFTPPSNWDSS